MKECLKTNEVCKTRKCKTCTFDTCHEVFNMLDIQEQNIRKEQIEKLRKNLPTECQKCGQYEIIDLKNMKVKCFYRVKRCLIK